MVQKVRQQNLDLLLLEVWKTLQLTRKKLTEDLDVLLQSEDSERMKRLQEEAKAKAEKEKNPSRQKVDETR